MVGILTLRIGGNTEFHGAGHHQGPVVESRNRVISHRGRRGRRYINLLIHIEKYSLLCDIWVRCSERTLFVKALPVSTT